MQIEELDLDVRTYNAVKRTGVSTVEQLRERIAEDPDSIRHSLGSRTFDRIKKTLAEPEEKNMIEITTKCPPAPAEPTTPEYLAAFNLNARIHYCKDSVERGLAEMCIGIEQMRSEKQYKQLGYQNFEDYCLNEFGFSDRQGRKYADVGKMLNNENRKLTSGFENLGMEKLHLLSKLDEPTLEVVAETVDVESVTVKELKAQIGALTAERDTLKASLESKDKQFKEAMESKGRQLQSTHKQWVDSQNEVAKLTSKNYDLEEQLKNLESRPVEVAVSEEEAKKIERLKKELEDEQLRAETIKKQADALKDEQEKKRLDLMKRHDQELKKLREGYEKQIADAGIDDESKRKIEDEAYIKAITQQFEDLVDLLEEWIEDLPPDDVLRHMKCIDEYYRKNLRYLMYQKGVED